MQVAFQPSDLLCPETLSWVPFERVRPALDVCHYVAFSRVPAALQGLGEEHNVVEGQPLDPLATQVRHCEAN